MSDLLKAVQNRRRPSVERSDPAPEMIQAPPTPQPTPPPPPVMAPEPIEEEKTKGTYYLYPSLIDKAQRLVQDTKGGWLWYLFTALVEVALEHPELHQRIRERAIAAREADKVIANRKRKRSMLQSLSQDNEW